MSIVNYIFITFYSLLNTFLVFKVCKRLFLEFQLDGYSSKLFFAFLVKSFSQIAKKILITVLVSFILCFAISFFIVKVIMLDSLLFISALPYFLNVLHLIKVLNSTNTKLKINYTKRFLRIFAIFLVFFSIFNAVLIYFTLLLTNYINYSILSISLIFGVLFIPFVNNILTPLELFIKHHYKRKAQKKLSKFKHLIKVGITGSYGKTSTKNILHKVLSQKYLVCSSPKSYNTEMGLAKVILNDLKHYHDVLICEMGANHTNDIKKLCKFIKPNIGIITAVGNSHLRTFKTTLNLQKTKYQLVDFVCKNNGAMIFNADNKISYKFYQSADTEKYSASATSFNADVFAINTTFSTEGTHFTLVTKYWKSECETKLLGRGHLEDILLSVAVAVKLKVDKDKIVMAIRNLGVVPHRLELKQVDNYYILDDAYNSNLQGASYALEVLSMFESKKIVVTPGIVELGKMSGGENKLLGQKISKIADVCIIVNETNKEAIKSGINNKIKCYEVKSLNEANAIIKNEICKNACVLYENDLPDNYI